ncbi:hypothetical protein FRC00_004808 [Tulasnella sp. 408]|nr:hypothetical protein FRC00_004808 [Tulasnella sp. 408]
MGGDEQVLVQEVELLDWRAKQVEAVPTKPPEGQSAMLSHDDRLLDALLIHSPGYFFPILRREFKKRAEERKWRHYPQYPNGTLITGRLTGFEMAATTDPSSCIAPENPLPFLPPEVIREIIRHATDTFPSPSSIHHPSPSTSQFFSPPPSHLQFPYSGYCRGDFEVDRKLHALSMKIKLSVSGVSRVWRSLAVEFLFNSIRIHDSKQILLLWHAIEGDAKRRGEQPSKENVAQRGSAPWWIRELWVDCWVNFDQINSATPSASAEFQLADLLTICPNIIKYRGLGSGRHLRSPLLWRDDAVLKQLLRLSDSWGEKNHAEPHEGQHDQALGDAHEVQGRGLDVPDPGRRIELCFIFGWEPVLRLLSDQPIPTPRTLTLPYISSLELRSLQVLINWYPLGFKTIRFPNLAHLSLRGEDSLTYATTNLILPSLRGVTLGSTTLRPLQFHEESQLESFLEKHGFALEELTILEKPYSRYLQRLDQLCPTLQTLRTHYLELPRSVVRSVTTVGLYDLEHAGRNLDSGENLVLSIFKVFPEVVTIQDMSWRSSVIRRRAYTNWTDPEGARYRAFWAQLLRTLRNAGSDDQLSAREVTLLDWRGKPVDAVPTKPPDDQRAMLGPDDQLLDALLSRARNLI